jgi:heat shock protein HtpX
MDSQPKTTMWELIRVNKRNSVVLLTIMAVVLVLLGFFIGASFGGPESGFLGIIIASCIWILLTIISFTSGDQILLSSSKAVQITHEVHPQLFNVVEEMTIAAGLNKVPKIYIINDPALNAFATGRNPQNASIAVTAGLLGKLNRDELQGVIAHEMSHIIHRDILFITLAGIMLGSIVLLANIFTRGLYYRGAGRRYSSGGRGGGQAVIIFVIIAIIAAILAPIMAQILYFAISRKREYLADAGSARLTRYPEGLASALQKIANDSAPQLASANKVNAPMFITNPFKKKLGLSSAGLMSTHPPIVERIKILRSMSGASYGDYSEAYTSTTGHRTIVPPSAMTPEQVAIRQAAEKQAREQKQQKQMHQVADIMRKVNGFIFLTCLCGLNLKIPPNFSRPTVNCPRCNRILQIPQDNSSR